MRNKKKSLFALLFAVLLCLPACQGQADLPEQSPLEEAEPPVSSEPVESESPSETPATPEPNPLADSERVRLWLEDIDAFSDGYKTNHIDLFYWHSEEFFDTQVEALRQRVPELSDDALALELQRIIASMDDAHSNVNVSLSSMFPFTFKLFQDGLYITNVYLGNFTNYSRCLRQKVVAVNGVAEEEIRELLYPLLSGERYPVFRTVQYAGRFQPEILALAGVPEREDGFFLFTLEDEEGQTSERKVRPISGSDVMRYAVQYPMYFMTDQALNWYTFEEGNGLLYFAYNTCSDPDQVLEDLFASMRDLLSGGQVRTVVVDLRNNGGGNSSLLNNMTNYLTQYRSAYENLYVVIGGTTFSSGIFAVRDLGQIDGAILIGTPTGDGLDHLGYVNTFTLPNSGLTCSYSIALWMLSENGGYTREGKQYRCGDLFYDELPQIDYENSFIAPDIYIENDIGSYRGTYDNVLDYIHEAERQQ